LFNADPQHPDFFPYTTEAFNALANNPDNVYYVAPIEEGGTYKISGYRGTVRKVDFQIGAGAFIPRGDPKGEGLGTTLANHILEEDVHIRKDGYFEVILSKERPAGYKGDWWKLGPRASYVLVRQTSYDWLHELDGRFVIDRLDNAAVRPRPSVDELDANLKQVAVWTEQTVKFSANFAKSIREQQGVNKIEYKDLTRDYSAITTQKYAYGGFDLEPDEALLVEVQMPKQACRYWSIHLIDDFAYILDWMNRQTNINGYTAKIDKDGKFRAVISAQDPGVPNWLDTAGYKTGASEVRWEKCSSWPDHKVTKIKTADARKYLPADTPVVSSDAREAAIRLRRAGAQMRRRW
jgi:hypothetical protein